jgi:hypothetical protein
MRIYGKNWTIKIGLWGLLLAGCQSAGDSIRKEFDRVNESLKESNKRFAANDPYEVDYRRIHHLLTTSPKKHPDWAPRVDSLYKKGKAFQIWMEDLSQRLEDADPAGNDHRLAEKMLTHNRLGDSLRNEMNELLVLCHAAVPDIDRWSSYTSSHLYIRDCTDRSYWNNSFSGKSTAEAATRLREISLIFQVDIQMIFEDMVKKF